jgi:hypothetical protein
MATLQSPGVQVTVINESFYTPAAPGTVPLIFVASASNKTNPSGTTAVGTDPANAGRVYLITSQRDLVDTFGTPLFYTDANGNPIHGGELNEYGLQAAYSLLGVSSAAYVVRAPIDLSALSASSSAPAGDPVDGSYWVNTSDSLYGIFEWNQARGTFTNQVPLVIDDTNSALNWVDPAPKSSFGLVGQYCVVLNQPASEVRVFYKNSDANWVEVGSRGETSFSTNSINTTFESTTWSTSRPAVTGTLAPVSVTITTSSVFTINGTSVGITNGDTPADIAEKINQAFHTTDGVGAKVINGALAIYQDASDADSVTIVSDSALAAVLGISSGTYNAPTVFVGPHTQYPDFGNEPSGSVYVKTTTPNFGASWNIRQWSASSNVFNTVRSPIYSDVASATYNLDRTGGGANIPVGTVFVESNYNHGDGSVDSPISAKFLVQRRIAVSPTTITSAVGDATVAITTSTLTIETSEAGSSTAYPNSVTLTVPASANGLDAIVRSINGSGIANLRATLNDAGTDLYTVSIQHTTGGEIRFTDTDGVLVDLGFAPWAQNPDTGVETGTANLYELDSTVEPSGATHRASNWKPMDFVASNVAPNSTPANGQLWYNSIVDQIDIMVHDGSDWRGYREVYPNSDPAGPIVSATRPTLQSDGTALVNGDIWVSTANLERYGQDVYVYSGSSLEWVQQDVADQTSPTGWLFADARWADNGVSTQASSIVDLLESSYVDPDAPDPAEYPRGMRLWNLRRSGFNIKRFVTDYININANDGRNLRYTAPGESTPQSMTNYSTNRWISVSPNNEDGSGTFGRKAQRSFVVSSFKAQIDGNQSIRDTDTLTFNLIATPGYPEAIANMVLLNVDRGLTAFVIGDTSFRLQPTGTELQAYGLNSNGAFDNGETGLVSYNEYMAVFYPSGFTNDLSGNNIVVPPSHMMLRTIATSDQKSYPWFAPAGIRRGVVDNATSVGYILNGEFRATALPNSIRDVMAASKINPIATITGAGIVNFGQYTRANAASALDRINVARLVAYLRRQLDILARPFLFEPNDKITRNEIKNSVQKLLLELVGQRALYDFIVVCDESNNTPARIDRSELWVDVAIEPVKAVEFIYIPVRLVNTGAIQAGTFTLA